MSDRINLIVLPRESMNWDEFVKRFPFGSIALDGIVSGGPRYDESTLHVNFDHHDGVEREATMSTSKQVYFAIKGGLLNRFPDSTQVLVNDGDQDSSLAVWLLGNSSFVDGVKSNPILNRLLDLTDKLDITAGSFPLMIDEGLERKHKWVYAPYTESRVSGQLAKANEATIRNIIESVGWRITRLVMGQAQEIDLDARYNLLNDSPLGFKVIEEIGSEARRFLFSRGMNAHISLVAKRPDGRFVYAIGRRTRYIPFPVRGLYPVYNSAEGLDLNNGWNGSDIVGGSSRSLGSGLDWRELVKLTETHLSSKQAKA